jgi:hypothetical protein
MTETTNEHEQYYDEQIAPRLREIAALCKARGMPMLAVVYFDGESSGLTQVPPEKPAEHPPWLLMASAWKARGNIDAQCMSLVRLVPIERDGSFVLRMLRPSTPTDDHERLFGHGRQREPADPNRGERG